MKRHRLKKVSFGQARLALVWSGLVGGSECVPIVYEGRTLYSITVKLRYFSYRMILAMTLIRLFTDSLMYEVKNRSVDVY